MSAAGAVIASATVTMGETHYAADIRAGEHALVADEPRSAGGGDAGPSPFDLLLSSLGACTAITLRMYAERKQWKLGAIEVQLSYRWHDEAGAIERVLTLEGLDAEQRARCAEIAEKTPVTRALKRGIAITTVMR
ncbi:MAG: OsmC family protein [Stellaceae bacterium]